MARTLALALACAVLVSCGDAPVARNAVLIVVDTLRWDHVGAYGQDRPISPALDGLAREGIRFERAYSPAPWTKPAVASLLTGLYPGAHGVQTMTRALPPEIRTLPEILSEAGFQTGAVVSHVLLSGSLGSGFGQGFDLYDESAASESVSTARVTEQAISQLAGFAADGRPFFLFVHYFDPHFEYLDHPDIAIAPPSAGRLDGSRGILALRKMRSTFTPDEVEFLVDRYDEEIRHTDDGIARVLATLDDLGRRDDTIVVVTADHGEEFLERGWLGHTRTLYEELVRVPLIVRHPGLTSAPRVAAEPVSTVSVTPTLLEWLGVDAPGVEFEAPSLSVSAPAAHGPVFAEVDWKPEHPLHKLGPISKDAVVDGRFKLVRDNDSQRVEVYDLSVDPLERDDLAADDELRGRLLELLEGRTDSGTPP